MTEMVPCSPGRAPCYNCPQSITVSLFMVAQQASGLYGVPPLALTFVQKEFKRAAVMSGVTGYVSIGDPMRSAVEPWGSPGLMSYPIYIKFPFKVYGTRRFGCPSSPRPIVDVSYVVDDCPAYCTGLDAQLLPGQTLYDSIFADLSAFMGADLLRLEFSAARCL